VVAGGKTRAESAYIGFSNVKNETDFVAIHDGARCLITAEMIDSVVRAAYVHSAATAVSAVSDTLKKVGENGIITNTISRSGMYCAQTPQVFTRDLYSRATLDVDLTEAVTDDNMLIERIGESVFAVETGRENIKITTPEDIWYAEFVLERRARMGEIRIGHGYDVHKLVENRKLILGGVLIPHSLGLLGHSDADVLTHAIMDALLGAAGLGDIGRHFPDTDGQYKDISSLTLLEKVAIILSNEGYSVENIDVTLVAQKPKIASYIPMMVENIAKVLGINPGRVNIKATTEESLGFTGREEGISCHAVTLIKK
jgi:2-C-methyl-D-erythritol 2,4-cyclodiphosphate synthase